MSSPVITTGFGTFGSVNLIPTLGFGGGVAPQPHGVILRRGKTKLWPNWKEELEEKEVQLDTSREELDDLLAQQLRISLQIKNLRYARKKQEERLHLTLQAAQVRKQLNQTKNRIRRLERDLEKAIRLQNELEEDEAVLVALFLIN